MSLFSTMVKPSMVKTIRVIVSERVAFTKPAYGDKASLRHVALS